MEMFTTAIGRSDEMAADRWEHIRQQELEIEERTRVRKWRWRKGREIEKIGERERRVAVHDLGNNSTTHATLLFLSFPDTSLQPQTTLSNLFIVPLPSSF